MTSQSTILMADDDMEDLELLEEALKESNGNFRFYKVQNGREVLDYLESKPDDQLPCLIILDYNMPELNGSQVLFELNKDSRYDGISKVIFSTSNAPTYINECRANGANDYFVKPTSMGDLNRIVQKLISYCMA